MATVEQTAKRRAAVLQQQAIEQGSGVAALQNSTVDPALIKDPVQKRATLINDKGDKITTESGSQDAQQLFGMGYKLMGADGKPVDSPAVPNITSPATDAVSSTDSLRNQRTQTQNDATEIAGNLSNMNPSVPSAAETSANTALDRANALVQGEKASIDVPEVQQAQQRLNDLYTQLTSGSYSDEEKAKIQGAVDKAKADYQVLIDKAEREKSQGMAKSTIAAGQQGGFMNTQFAGIAALAQTNGNSFVGAGGELNRIKSEYDLNIQDLESRQLSAMQDAKNAAESAIRSGKMEDLQVAQQMFENAKSLNDERNDLANNKAKAIYDWQSSVIEMQKYERETASATIEAMVGSGKSVEDVPSWVFQDLDQKSGYASGVSKSLFEVAQGEKAAAGEEAYLDQMTKVMDLTSKLKPNQSVTIGGIQYYGTKSNTTFEGKEIDKATGDVLLFNRNIETGEMSITRQTGVLTPNIDYSVQEISNADGSKSLWYVPKNPVDGPAIPVNGQVSGGAQGVNMGTIQQQFPAGTTYAEAKKTNPSLTESDFWCLRFIGNMDERGDSFINLVGDTLADKRSSVDPSIGVNNVQAGDYIVTNEDSRYGHFALVNEIRTDPTTGKKVAVLTESNYKPLTVGHTRTIELTDQNTEANGGKVVGFLHSQLKPEYTSQGLVTNQLTSSAGNADPQKVIENLNKIPEVQDLQNNRDLRTSLLAYQNLVKDYGTSQNVKIPTSWLPWVSSDITFALQPKQRDALQNAYASIVADYKTAKKLGTLDAGVEKLLQGLLPNLANAGDIGQYIKAGSIITDTSKMISDMDKKAEDNYNLVVSGNPEYANSTYLNDLRGSYGEPSSGSVQEPLQYSNANDENVKEAIANGWTVEKQGDGSVIIYPPK